MTKPKAWMAFSSGKDSVWALHQSILSGDFDIVGLLTTVTDPYDRVSMHGVRRSLLDRQSQELGIPLVIVSIPATCTNEIYERKMADAMKRAKAEGITHIIFGDLFLEGIRKYREQNLKKADMQCVFPLWGIPTNKLAEDMIDAGLKAIVTCVDPKKVPCDISKIAGRYFDRNLLSILPDNVDPCAENGEFHTVVVGGPMFRQDIAVTIGKTTEREGFIFTDVIPD